MELSSLPKGDQLPVNVVCMKWGSKYGPEYVNRLRSMVQRNLKRQHRFICFTEDATGIDSNVEIRPLPPVKKPHGPEQFWNKLGLLSHPLSDIVGTVLSLDLDLVIVDSIDEFFDFPGSFVIAHEFTLNAGPKAGNSSVFRFEAGAQASSLREFEDDPSGMAAQYRYDQDFMSDRIKPITFWPQAWCVSFRRHCMHRFPWFYFRSARIPEGAKIVAFHGFPNPPNAIAGYFRMRGMKLCWPVKWVRENWK